MSAVRAASSSGVVGTLRCVERCCPRTRQARRSETPSAAITCSTQARRREGLTSFPLPPLSGSASPPSGQRPPDANAHFPLPVLSSDGPGHPSGHQTPYDTDITSPPSRRSREPRPRPTFPVSSTAQPAAISRQSLQPHAPFRHLIVLQMAKNHTSRRTT